MPAPPVTINAPVAVLVLAVALAITACKGVLIFPNKPS
jgi:hypothetical protein